MPLDRRERNFDSPNRLQLGTFGTNLAGGLTVTTMPEKHKLNWPNVAKIAGMADALGFELQVPVARWKTMGGPSDFQGRSYETLTWAAGLGAITKTSSIFATAHIPVIHPLLAAKQMTTIDHITDGRFGFNLVCGWFEAEFTMFGLEMLKTEYRYDYAAEWIQIVRGVWEAEEEFDFEGKYFKVVKAWHQPKPIRKPFPPVMNAATSPPGINFMAQYADIGFINIDPEDSVPTQRQKLDKLRDVARSQFKRNLDVWSYGWVVCRPTEKEAREYRDYCVKLHGDMSIIDGAPPALRPETDEKKRDLMAGWGGVQLVGTPEQIVDRLSKYAEAGIDGLALVWPDYVEGLTTWAGEIEPLLKQAGLRV